MESGVLIRTDDRTDVRTGPGRRLPWLQRAKSLTHPIPAALITAAGLHLFWVFVVANPGGDLAAQDAWAEFARLHPGSAYNLAWYGGVHPASYSAISPYVMATLGVRTTMMLAGTVSAGLLALLLVRSNALRRPLWPALYGALALTGNAVSGRVTFGLGLMFGLAAMAVIFAWPDRWRSTNLNHQLPRAALAAALSALATASSPVAGLFLGVVAAALWLDRRHAAAYAIGVPPVAVVALSAWLFPFSGHQPMAFTSTILPVICGLCGLVLAPKSWVTVRIGSALYCVGVLVCWVVPSQIGTNVTRLGLVFGGVVLVAIAAQARPRRRSIRRSTVHGSARAAVALGLAIAMSSIWQVSHAAKDVISTRPTEAWTLELGPLLRQLEIRNAEQARVEVVPARSHREASALASHVNLARGWNRQADAERNPIFYTEGLLTPVSYREWLDRWAVKYVVLPTGKPDGAAIAESALVAGGLSYLHEVWSAPDWRLFEVVSPTPLADPPAVVTSFDATELVLYVPSAGTFQVRIPDSPWLSLVDENGDPLKPPKSDVPDVKPVNFRGCLSGLEPPTTGVDTPMDDWTLLHAPRAGFYRIAAPYKVPRGTTCPKEMVELAPAPVLSVR
jgi:hypothetical protein